MPDYRYIKDKVNSDIKSEAIEKEDIQNLVIKLYHLKEEEMIDLLIKEIKRNIEQSIYYYYRNGHTEEITKRGWIKEKYLYNKTLLNISSWMIDHKKRIDLEELLKYGFVRKPEDGYPEWRFPNIELFNVFIEKVNYILSKEKIKVKVKEDSIFKGSYYFEIFADLGEL